MKKTLIIFLFLSFTIAGIAQNIDNYYIYLNNGNVIQGHVIQDNTDNLNISVQDLQGETINLKRTDINKITKQPMGITLKEAKPEYIHEKEFDKGFWWSAEFYSGCTCNVTDEQKNGGFSEFNLTAGYRYSEYIRFGIGFGGRYYIQNSNIRYKSIKWSFPLYFNIRGNMINSYERRVVPYYSLSIGGATQDGFMLRPTIGIRIGDYKRSALLVSISYLGQNLKRPQDGKLKSQSFAVAGIGYEF